MTEVWTLLKVTEKIPTAGKYKCLICWLVVEIEQNFVDRGTTFFVCPICKAWAEDWPIWPEEEVRQFMG